MAKILLVDDDELIAEIVQDSLYEAGHIVGWLQDGQKLLDVVKIRPPDIVILDQMMPGLSGTEILRQLRRNPATALLPVLMLTAVSGRTDQNIAYYEGADDYLTKPFDPEMLVFRVEELIGQSRRTIPAAFRT